MSGFPKTETTGCDVSLARRQLLTGAGVALVAGTFGGVTAAGAAEHAHDHGHHHATMDAGRMRVVDHAMACIKDGQICVQHCIDLFKAGDTSVADCADSVQEMLASCTAMAQLATYDSRHLKDLMRVCIGVCEDCEKECRKHEDKHAECKACADSCADCIKVCQEYLA